MSAHVTVYCHKSIARVTAEEIREGLKHEDWHLMGEFFDVDDDEIVNSALSYFCIKGENGNLTVHFRPPEQRQLEITLIDGQHAREWMDEEIEEINKLDDSGYEPVVHHLREAVEIVDIEIGYFQFVEMAPVFAYAVARWFAEIGNGWIKSNDDDWWKVDGRVFISILSTRDRVK